MAEKGDENFMVKKINDYSDKKLSDMMEDDKLTNIEPMPNIGLNDEKNEKNIIKDNIDLNNKLTASNTNNDPKSYPRTDNVRVESFIALMVFLKDFFKKYFNLDFSSFKCEKVLGPGIAQMKKILNLKIYQILCYYPKNIKKIIEASKKIKNKREKRLFYYFMTRTYEELYNRYISGDINFPLFNGGTVRICSFTTLVKEIKKKKEKEESRKKKRSEEFIKKKLEMFEELSLTMIDDIKRGNLERKPKKEKKEFITVIIHEFESKRLSFNENDDYNGYRPKDE